MSWRGVLGLVSAALLLALLDSIKPLHVDDALNYRSAAHIATHPLDPYGLQTSSPAAIRLLVPPVLPYWWAVALRLFGDRPFLWKMWLFPFCLLFVFALHALLRRFAPGVEAPLLWMTVLSPSFLPSLNLMLDIPALALSLTALATFIRAVERESELLAVMAGLVAGLAMQTKYTALVLPAVTLLYAALYRKTPWGLLAASVAILVFVSWEGFVALGYGESQFLHRLRLENLSPFHRRIPRLVLPLVAILGGVAPALALLGLGALGAPRRIFVAAVALVGLGFCCLALVPDQYATFAIDRVTGRTQLTVNNLVFGTLGVWVCATLAAVIRRFCPLPSRRVGWLDQIRAHPVEWFLLLWLVLELGAYFVLSPFPAVRRVYGLVVAATVLVGRFVSHSLDISRRVAPVRGALALSALLGSMFYGVDLLDALAQKEAIEQAVGLVRARDPSPTVWYAGCWGLEFYADRAGMKPIIPERSQLRKGDWLVIPRLRIPLSPVCLPGDRTALVATVRADAVLPLTTVSSYYGGRTPMEHLDGPRLSTDVYRVGMDFVDCQPE